MEDLQQPAKNELARMNIKDLFYKYVRFLPLFIVSIAVFLFGAYIYLRYATLIYSSTGTMVIQSDNGNRGNSNDKFVELLQADNGKNIQNEIEYLRSAKLMSRVVTALNLNIDYKAIGKIKKLNIYKGGPFLLNILKLEDSASAFTLKFKFDSPNAFHINNESSAFTYGQVFRTERGMFRLEKTGLGEAGGEYEVSWSPTMSVAGGLAGAVAVAPKQNTGILVLSLESTNPNLAADVINQLMVEYGKATIEDKNQETQNKLNFIDKRLGVVGDEVDSITRKRLDFLKQNQLFNLDVQATNQISRIEAADQERTSQNVLLNKTFLVEDDLIKGNSIPVPSSLGLDDPILNSTVAAYNEAQLRQRSLEVNAPPGNIAVRQNAELIDRLRSNIRENLGNIRQAYRSVISNLNSVQNTAQSQIQLMPEKQQALVEIQRQLEGKEEIYKSFLVERERSQIILASTISNIKVLTDARPSYGPVKPNRRSIQLLAIAIGLLLPALFIFILEILNDKVTTRSDIERFTSATILGEVGHSFGKNNLVATNNNRSVVAEQFRIIRSNLQYVLNNIEKPVILVTSSFSGEGKSFISTNIGAVMALAGRRTIILEFDIRKPKILSHLNISKKPGLTNYLLGKLKLEELPVPVPDTENLFVLPCGPVPPNPSELLLDPKLNDLFVYLKQNFDIVIMDTAPVGMVSDAMTLSRFSDCTMYIVRQGHTYKKQIGSIDEFYHQGKLPKISLILNDVKVRTGYGYYGYGRYGYGYGYGSGYFDEEDIRQQSFWNKYFGWMKKKKRKQKQKQH